MRERSNGITSHHTLYLSSKGKGKPNKKEKKE